jgi:hypothetical protein
VNKFLAIALSVLAGTFAGCVAAVLAFLLKMPLFYIDAQKALSFTFYGLPIVVIIYQAVPLASLSFLAGWGRRPLTLKSCVLVVVVWLVLFLAFWYRHTIFNTGSFPMWAVKRDFMPLLVIMLATAWGFWRAWSCISPKNV